MSSSSHGNWIEAGREAGLLLSAQQGDLDSFRELLRVHYPPLYRLCFALSGRPEVAGQIMVESSRLAWRSLRQLPVGRPFYPYLARIARNLAVAHQRRHAGERGELPEHRPSGLPWGGGNPNPALVAEEQRLLQTYQELTVDEQFLCALSLVERLSYAQIAQVLDIPVGSVMHRLQALRSRFEKASRGAAA